MNAWRSSGNRGSPDPEPPLFARVYTRLPVTQTTIGDDNVEDEDEDEEEEEEFILLCANY